MTLTSSSPSPHKLSAPAAQVALVVGAGASGCAAAKLLHYQGHRVRILDTKAIPEAIRTWAKTHDIETVIGPHKAAHFEDASLVIPSPGVAASTIKPLLPHGNDGLLMAETELAWRALEGETLIAVTGTSGKTTTASLISAILTSHGLNVFTGGNIGTPLSAYILDRHAGAPKADVIVLELSSFQLQTCSTLRPHVALFLNLSENHLDYHADMQEYIDAKMQLLANQTLADTAIVHESLKPVIESYTINSSIQYFGATPYDGARFTPMRLMGHHNQLNAEAAALACATLHVPFATSKEAASSFVPIAHRLEYIAELQGVHYVNDSKATTIDALRVALEACKTPVLLLAGGIYKGGELKSLIPLLQSKVKAVALFGGSKNIFEDAWQGHTPLTWDNSLESALCRHQKIAVAGDTILLAPATSSYDQYNNYMCRGEDFIRIVKEILPC